MIKVSVIIPIYNVENYLPQCLDSILGQSLKDIEIICVDDGSTDLSLQILKEYAAKDARIQVLQQPNSGAGIARNTGMKVARGKYLSILDSDDFFEPHMLETVYQQIEKDQADICVFRSDQYDQQSNQYNEIPWTIKQRYLPEHLPFTAADIYPHVFQIFNGWSWDKLYRRAFVEKNNLQFQGLRTTNDAFFVFMNNVQAGRITILEDILAHHRVNTKTSLSVTREKSWDCCWQAISAIRDELIARDQYRLVEQSFVNWAVHFLLWNVRTLQDVSRNQLIDAIQNQYSAVLDIGRYKKEYFYNKNEYQEFINLCKTGVNANVQENTLTKTLRYLRENGLKATVRKIIKIILGGENAL